MRELNVFWWGSTENEYQWLIQRIQAYQPQANSHVQLEIVSGPLESLLERLHSQTADRVIVAKQNRWEYPAIEMQQLSSDFPEVPVALCLGDYWLGWKRTGAGHLTSLPHLSLPWFRWWDAWIHWLEADDESKFGPFPIDRPGAIFQFPKILNQSDLNTESLGWIFCSDMALVEAWQFALGDQFRHYRDIGLTTNETLHNEKPAWIVWDDSCMPTWCGAEASLQIATEQLQSLASAYPRAKLWASWTFPTWSIIERMKNAGVSAELLGKPYLLSTVHTATDNDLLADAIISEASKND